MLLMKKKINVKIQRNEKCTDNGNSVENKDENIDSSLELSIIFSYS